MTYISIFKCCILDKIEIFLTKLHFNYKGLLHMYWAL